MTGQKQRHEAIVPGGAGTTPWCTCGWRQPTPRGPYLFEHLREQNGEDEPA